MTLGLPIAADYKPSEGELDNLIYLTIKYTTRRNMRACDKSICLMMAGSSLVGDVGISTLIETTCEYAWDHLAGEPGDVSTQDFFDHIKPMLLKWYSTTTPEERAITS